MSTIIGNPIMLGGGGISAPKFTYTGTYEYIDDGNGNWRIKFLTSGVFTPLKDMVIEVFLVGAGGGGGRSPNSSSSHPTVNVCSSGGGGGFTKTVRSVILTKDTAYEIVVGVGGAPEVDGGSTSAFNATVSGGKQGDSVSGDKKGAAGGAGGSGGGGANTSPSNSVGAGGSDGSDGGSVTYGAAGTGQGTTTREFGEATGDLYSGGGGSVSKTVMGTRTAAGGDGGGAKGGESAADNTGGGGGGNGGYGGSGIVIIRKHKEAAA